MSKLKETNSLMNHIMDDLEKNPSSSVVKAANVVLLADIAKSLAMIADKLCEEESESKYGDFLRARANRKRADELYKTESEDKT